MSSWQAVVLAQDAGGSSAYVGLAMVSAPPVVAGLVAAVGLWLKERTQERDQALCRKRAVEEELAHLGYLKTWLETQQLVGGDSAVQEARAHVQSELRSSHLRLQNAVQERHESGAADTLERAWRKAALVPLQRPGARRARHVYWTLLGLAAFVLTSVWNGVDEEPAVDAFVALLLSSPFLAVAVSMHALARHLEASWSPVPAQRVDGRPPGPLPEAGHVPYSPVPDGYLPGGLPPYAAPQQQDAALDHRSMRA